MSIAKIQRNVYAIGGRLIDDNDANAYLVYDDEKNIIRLLTLQLVLTFDM